MSLNGTEFGGRSLTVNEARPKNEGRRRRSLLIESPTR